MVFHHYPPPDEVHPRTRQSRSIRFNLIDVEPSADGDVCCNEVEGTSCGGTPFWKAKKGKNDVPRPTHCTASGLRHGTLCRLADFRSRIVLTAI